MDSSLIEVFVYENMQLLDQLEKTLLAAEKSATMSKEQINEVFRVMHTIKGSASMMEFSELAHFAHALEDLFDYIRSNTIDEEFWSEVFDNVLDGIDFFKVEISKLQDGLNLDGDSGELTQRAHDLLAQIKSGKHAPAQTEQPAQEAKAPEPQKGVYIDEEAQSGGDAKKYKITVEFQQGCGMETIRALAIVMSLKGMYSSMKYEPSDLEGNCDKEITENGFRIELESTLARDELSAKLGEAILVQSVEIEEIKPAPAAEKRVEAEHTKEAEKKPEAKQKAARQPESLSDLSGEKAIKQSFISINVNKIDRLMNLVGEIVTTESMVTKSPDLDGLKLEHFSKQARQLRKLTNELQDVVMSIRMVPISSAFNKMQRIVRDMSKKINKEADLVIIGENTEVDKNVIEFLNDPLMHLIRNSMDHGLEPAEERLAAGKSEKGSITLEAYNTGGDVIVSVSDDGRGLDRDKIARKAIDMGLTTKSEEELSDQEIYAFILEPGFSTNKEITEYSGRGVGMDVVNRNIEAINGSISIDSKQGHGTVTKIHIPLTLAIVDGMVVSVGREQYIIPVLSIRESFEAKNQKIFTDPNGTDMVIIRDECYRILRLSNIFGIPGATEDYNEGIMVMIEAEAGATCLFVDKLIGEQQAVIKPIPEYITKRFGRIKGISGCTVLGDGGISMILDCNAILNVR